MKNQEILDAEFSDKTEYVEIEVVRWWERKRLLYNALLFGLEIFLMLLYGEETMRFGIGRAIILTLITNFIANIFYTAGWVLEIFISFYFKKRMPSAFKKVLFVLGTLFSLTLAFIFYNLELSPF